MLKAKISDLKRRVHVKLPNGLRHRRGAFGVDAAIMIGFIMAMMAALAVFTPSIIQMLAGMFMGGAKGAYTLFVELPAIPDNPSKKPASGASAAQWVGWAAANLHGLLQNVALGLLAVVLIIAAMCYIFETFRFMGEGTAMNIILNSIFTVIMIFAVRYIYNGVAAAINAFTGWKEVGGTGLIIQGGHEIDALVNAMGGGTLGSISDAGARFFGSVIILIISTSVLVLATMMGVVRLLLIGCLAAALPLLLMLRLIPPVKHLADSLIETVIGIMFASVIAAIFLHFGYLLVTPEVGLGNLTKLIVALATFAGAAYMSTMFAGRLGGLFTTVGGMASMASSTATGLLLGGAAMGAAGGAGAVTGVVHAAKSGLPAAGGALRGALSAMGKVAATTLPAALVGASPAKTFGAAVGAMPAAAQSAQEAVKNRVGTVAERLLFHFAANKVSGELPRAEDGLDWYHSHIEGRTDRQLGEYLSDKLHLEVGDVEKFGAEFRKLVEGSEGAPGLKRNPALLDQVRRGIEYYAKASQAERLGMIKKVLDKNVHKNDRNKVAKALGGKKPYDPRMEVLDRIPDYYTKVLTNSHLGDAGLIVKARMFGLARRGFEEKVKEGTLSSESGIRVAERVNDMSDEKAGRWTAETFGVKIPGEKSELYKELGHQVKGIVRNFRYVDPRLLDNLEKELAKEGSFEGKDPKPYLEKLNDNIEWLQKIRVSGRLFPVRKPRDVFDSDEEAFASFWRNIDSLGSPQLPPQPPKSPPQHSPPSPSPGKGKRVADINDAEKMGQILKELENEKGEEKGSG